MVGQCERWREADEQRLDEIAVAGPIDGHNRGSRFAIHEALEQGEVALCQDNRMARKWRPRVGWCDG
jgi:hypothetical protein